MCRYFNKGTDLTLEASYHMSKYQRSGTRLARCHGLREKFDIMKQRSFFSMEDFKKLLPLKASEVGFMMFI